MNLESQVVSLELAKRLQELSVKVESHFYWKEYGVNWTIHSWDQVVDKDKAAYPAYTVAELGEMLPTYLGNSQLTIYKIGNNGGWKTDYTQHDHPLTYMGADHMLVNSLAKMLIYLLENKLMEVPQ